MTITEDETIVVYPCPPWCQNSSEHGVGAWETRSHTTDEATLKVEDGEIALCVVADETQTENGTVHTAPLVRLMTEGHGRTGGVLLTVDQLLSLSDMAARAALILGKVERGESL